MKLLRTTHRGLTCFRDTVEIDYAAAGPGLIALVGDNGAGKTTAMEAAPASLFKRFPTRPGSLYDHCSGSDCFVESIWDDDGREIRVRLVIDAERRRTEGYVYVNGEAYSTGKAASFESAIADLFGSSDLFLSSVFAAQDKSGSFLAMRKGERKSLFAELLGLAGLEALAERARAEAAQAAGRVDKHRAVLAAVEGDGDTVEDLAGRLADAEHNLGISREARDAAVLAERDAGAAVESARGAADRLRAATDAATAADRSVVMTREAQREATIRPLRIRTDATRLRDGIAARGTENLEAAALTRYDVEAASIDSRRAHLRTALDDLPNAAECESKVAALRTERGKLEKAAAEFQTKRDELEALKRTASQRHDEWKRAQAEKTRRVEELRDRVGMIDTASCKGDTWADQDGNDMVGSDCPLLKDAYAARERLDALVENTELDTLSRVAIDADAARLALQEEIDGKADDVTARNTRLAEIAPESEAAQRDLARAWSAENLHTELGGLDERQADAKQHRDDEIATARGKLMAEDESLARIDAEETRELAEADAAIVTASERLIAAEQEDAATAATVAGLRATLDAGTLDAAQAARQDALTARTKTDDAVRQSQQAVDQLEMRIEAAKERAATADAAREAADAALTDLGDWNLLAEGAGKDGIQAHEIAAAAPEISGITNELLQACYGPRFSLTLETLAEKRDGTMREAFDVQVYDGKHPRRVENLSGGERVIVGEALSLALAVYNARKSNVNYETIFRDETVGALDAENAQAYVLMLRRAMELGAFTTCIFVSHSADVIAAADSRLYVADGAVTTEPREVAA